MLYVSFDDSKTDPTYSYVGDVSLVIAPDVDGNPCVSDSAEKTPLVPNNIQELVKFAEVFGWSVKEVDGVYCVVTHFTK